MKYQVKLSQKGYSELMQLRGNPSADDPNAHITRNRGGLFNIGREWTICNDADVDIAAIKADVITKKDGGDVEIFPWFNVKILGESEGQRPKIPKPTSSDLKAEAETELAEDKQIAKEVNRCKGILADGKTQCSRQSLPGELYCKTHLSQGE